MQIRDIMKLCTSWFLVLSSTLYSFVANALPETRSYQFTNDGNPAYLQLAILSDTMIHAEYGLGTPPGGEIASSVMVFRKDQDYSGPSSWECISNVCETSKVKYEFNSATGCLAFYDKLRGNNFVSEICPVRLYEQFKGFSLNKDKIQAVYGIAQYFNRNSVGPNGGTADGDWISHGFFSSDNSFGNAFSGFPADNSGGFGANSQVQFPVMHALGDNENFALFLDNVYKQNWDFGGPSIETRMFGEVRFYIMLGSNMIEARQQYMDLVGKPPVPRKRALGMWLSEFGYDNWEEIDYKLWGEKNGKPALRNAGFPVDGIVLDLQWYGSVEPGSPDSQIGSYDFDPVNFPDAQANIQRYRNENIELSTIEQSYVAKNRDTYQSLLTRDGTDSSQAGHLIHRCGSDDPIQFDQWVGRVGQIDWSAPGAGAWIHDNKRKPNINDLGIYTHWTDLGEPEMYDPASCYDGVVPGRNQQADVHNIYNFLWHKSIYEGYKRNNEQQRPFMLARAGAPGMQRFGAAMWSGDITSRLEAYAVHMNAQMHMSFNGIDYYGSDIGGFYRRSLFNQFDAGTGDRNRYNDAPISEIDMFSQWFAGSSWTDVPVRPHTNNCGSQQSFGQDPGCPYETSPAWIGDVNSNRFAIQQRYELTPYYYSLTHEAHNNGYPVVAAPIMHFDKDKTLRQMGSQKMIGPYIMVALVASHGQPNRAVYLPKGKWVNYHTNEPYMSNGEYTTRLDLYGTGKLVLPAFVKAGGIVPTMYVDHETQDVFGNRPSGKINTLILKVYSDTEQTSFTLWEDDGEKVQNWEPLTYNRRSIQITQSEQESSINIDIGAASGNYEMSEKRDTEVRVVSFNGANPTSITLNGNGLTEASDSNNYDSLSRGWIMEGRVIKIKTGSLRVSQGQSIVISTNGIATPEPTPPPSAPISGATTRTIIFIEAATEFGQDMFVRGGIDHTYAQTQLGLSCNAVASVSQCAIPIKHLNYKNEYTAKWKQGDTHLDWYGEQVGQCDACEPDEFPFGTPMEWTTNDPSAETTVEEDGFGYTPVNKYGPNMWMLDVNMNCSKTFDGWFELKSFITNGPGWEGDISQGGTPYQTGNHFARCGSLNVFKRGESTAIIIPLRSALEDELIPANISKIVTGGIVSFFIVGGIFFGLNKYLQMQLENERIISQYTDAGSPSHYAANRHGEEAL